jgi:hypothetical protein
VSSGASGRASDPEEGTDMSAPITTAAERGRPNPHTVTVLVNEKPVNVPAPKVTGLEIKQAAMNAGLPVQLDFVLSEERPNGDTDIVGDEDEVTVNKNSKFLAIAPDDNS